MCLSQHAVRKVWSIEFVKQKTSARQTEVPQRTSSVLYDTQLTAYALCQGTLICWRNDRAAALSKRGQKYTMACGFLEEHVLARRTFPELTFLLEDVLNERDENEKKEQKKRNLMAVLPNQSCKKFWSETGESESRRVKLLLKTDRKVEVCTSLGSMLHRRGALLVKEIQPANDTAWNGLKWRCSPPRVLWWCSW